MGSLEISELDETVQRSAPAVNIAMARQHQVQANEPTISRDSSTTLLIENPMIGHPWTTGLFDCHEDPRNAIMTACCPCVTFSQIAEVLSEGKLTCQWGSIIYFLLILASYSQWILSTEFRTKLRKKYDLEEAPCTDVAAHIFCPFCSLCQEYRELKNRGLDPALGWSLLLAQQQGSQDHDQPLNVPPPNQVMSK